MSFAAILASLHPPRVSDFTVAEHEIFPAGWEAISNELRKNRPIIVNVRTLGANVQEQLQRFGISAHSILADLTPNEAYDVLLRERAAIVKREFRPLAEEFQRVIFQTSGFRLQSHTSLFFDAGGLLIVDPFMGTPIISTHSFMVDSHHVIYRYRSVEVFYLMVGRTVGEKIAFSFPRLNLVILLHTYPASEELDEWTIDINYNLLTNLIVHHKALLEQLKSINSGGAVLLGTSINLGHYIWQDLAGLEDTIVNHGPTAIKNIIEGCYARFPTKTLFPELQDAKLVTLENTESPFAESFHLPFQYLRPIGIRVRRSLKERILAAARMTVSPGFIEDVRRLSAERFLLWINLRVHNKAWVCQVEGWSEVIAGLSQRIDNIAVVLDGFPDVAGAAQELLGRLPPEVGVINTVGAPLGESIIWANAVHAFVSVVGSGLVLNSWLANKPGVAHSNRGHLGQEAFWGHICDEVAPTTFVPYDDVKDEGELYGNYDMEPAMLIQLIIDLVGEYYPERLIR